MAALVRYLDAPRGIKSMPNACHVTAGLVPGHNPASSGSCTSDLINLMSLSTVICTKMSSDLRNLASTGLRCHQALKCFRPCSFYSWAYAALSVFVLCPGTLKGKVAPNDTLMVDDLLMILGTNFQAPFQIPSQFFLRH